MTTRTLSVGRTRLNESTALIRVSEPPYMFSAVTEIRPSGGEDQHDRAEAGEDVVAAASSSAMPVPSKFLPPRRRGRRRRIIIQTPPIAEPQ